MNTDRHDMVRQMADEIFEKGASAADIKSALAELGDNGDKFLQRLAIRAALEAGAAASDFGPVPDAISDKLIASYNNKPDTAVKNDISAPSTWLVAKAWFGNDLQFIMKLVGRQVSPPSSRFLRDAADALGVSIDRLKEHFALAGNPTLSGIERKASGRQVGPDVQPFEDAVNASKLPNHLKKRWMEE